MPFDPDAFLKEDASAPASDTPAFNPDYYLSEPAFNPDAFLAKQADQAASDDAAATVGKLRAEAAQRVKPAAPMYAEPGFLEKAASYAGRRYDDLKPMVSNFVSGQTEALKKDVMLHGGLPISQVDAIKASIVDPVMQMVQEHNRSELESGFARGTPGSPTAELMKRSAFQLIAGQGILEGMDEGRKLKAINDINDIFNHPIAKALTKYSALPILGKLPIVGDMIPSTPEKQAAMAIAVPQEAAGMIPILLTGGGGAIDLGSSVSASTQKVIGAGLQAARYNGAASLAQPGAKPSEEAVKGFGLGILPGLGEGLLNLVGATGSQVANLAESRLLGAGTSVWADEVASEVSQMKVVKGNVVARSAPGKVLANVERAVLPAGEPHPFITEAKVSDPTFKPGIANVAVDYSTGNLKGQLVQKLSTGETRIAEMPITSLADAAKFKIAIGKTGAPLPLMSAEALQHPDLTTPVVQLILRTTAESAAKDAAIRQSWDPDYLAGLDKKTIERGYQVKNKTETQIAKDMQEGPGTKVIRTGSLTPKITPVFNLDEVVPSIANTPVAISHSSHGYRIDPIRDMQTTGVIKPDDLTEATLKDQNLTRPDTAPTKGIRREGNVGIVIQTPPGGTYAANLQTQVRGPGDIAKVLKAGSGIGEANNDNGKFIVSHGENPFAGQVYSNPDVGYRVNARGRDWDVIKSDAKTLTVRSRTGPTNHITIKREEVQSYLPPDSAEEREPYNNYLKSIGRGGEITQVRGPGDIAKIVGDQPTAAPLIGGGSGPPFQPPPPKPPPAPVPAPGEMPAQDLTVIQTLQSMAKQAAQRPSAYEAVMRQLIPSHVRGPQDLAQLAAMQKGIKQLEQSGIDTINAIQKTFGKSLTADFEADLFKLAKAPNETERLKFSQSIAAKPYGQMFEKHKEMVYNLLRERDANNAMLESLGVTKQGDTLFREQGKLDAYTARSFMAYLLQPGKWAKVISQDQAAIYDGIKWLREQKGLTDNSKDSDIAIELDDIIGSEDPIAAISNPKYGIKSAQHLKVKQDLPPVLLKLLGNIESGSVAIGISLGTQRALIANASIWREIAMRPDIAVPSTLNDASKLNWKKLPDNKRWYGDAAGMYVDPKVYDNMVTLPNTIENSKFFLQTISSFVKGMEVAVGGAATFVRHAVYNVYGSILAGGIDPLGNPTAAMPSINKSARAMLDFNKQAGSFGPPTTTLGGMPMSHANIVLEARRIGVDTADFHATEISPIEKRLADQMLEKLVKEQPANYMSYLQKTGDIIKKFISVHKSPSVRVMGAVIDQGNRLAKLSNWVALVDKFTSDPVGNGITATDLPTIREQAKRLAATRVNDSFHQYSMLAPGVDKVKKSGVFIVNKFFSSLAEHMRVAGSIPKRLTQEPDLKWRLFKYLTAMAALFGGAGIARRLNGIPDEECTAALLHQNPELRKAPDFMQACLPIRDSLGRAQIHDLSGYIPITKFLNGVQDEPMFQRVLTNAFTMPAEGGGAQDTVGQTTAAFGAEGTTPQISSVRPGEAGVLNGLQYAWDKLDLGPKGISKLYNSAVATGALGGLPSGVEPMTIGQAVAANTIGTVKGYAIGANSPSGTSQLLSQLYEFRRLKNSIRGIMDKPDDMAMKMLPQLIQMTQTNPQMQKDVRLQATLIKMMQISARISQITAADAAAEQAKAAPPQILPRWAR